MDTKTLAPCTMVIFGGTGDLTHRKLVPALYNLIRDGLLPEHFAVVCVGRKHKSKEEYLSELLCSTSRHSRFQVNTQTWKTLSDKIYYYRLEFSDSAGYKNLKGFLEDLDKNCGTLGNRLYYLAVSPEYFETITLNLKYNQMAESPGSWHRLVIEKPFGKSLETARYLNSIITDVFSEENIYRIDHYLGKEMLQNLLVFRFGNAMFENIWNSRYIDNIQITFSETVGVENRGGYYDSSGALRDMLQNHMLQLLSLVAMEPPASLETEAIRDEKVKLLRTLESMTPATICSNTVRGQFGEGSVNGEAVPGYRQENGVSLDSATESFAAVRLFIKNFRWGSMPFYLRTGKRLPEKCSQIVIEFKSLPDILYFKAYKGLMPNLLVIRIQPREGISFYFNAKKPGALNEITNVNMDFCQNCHFKGSSPEAYERLLSDALRKDATLFTRWDEIESSWRFIDSIANVWQNDKPDFPNYTPGTWGPQAAYELLARDGRKWWEI